MNSTESTPTRPYLIRALHAWCMDNGFTPLMTVQVDGYTRVPKEHVKDDEIVLNLSLDATSGLRMGNEFIEFKARFSGVARDIVVPIGNVMAIYARENGQGMAFPVSHSIPKMPNSEFENNKKIEMPTITEVTSKVDIDAAADANKQNKTNTSTRPFLKVVK